MSENSNLTYYLKSYYKFNILSKFNILYKFNILSKLDLRIIMKIIKND